MKKFLLSSIVVFSLVLITASDIFSQWVPQTSGITTRLRALPILDDNVVWACGNNGVVLKTTDGGTTWTAMTPTDAGSVNYTVEAFDATTAWVTGTVGGTADFRIWKTTDGGTSWVSQYNNPTGFGDAVRFFDANNGVCFADPDPYPSTHWEILTTSDGGANWTRVPTGNYPPADSVNGEYGAACSMKIIGNTVWFSGYSAVTGTEARVFKSTDMGLNWTVSSFPQKQGASGSNFLAFSDANNGIDVCLDGTVASTTNGGATWDTTSVTGAAFRFATSVPGFPNAYVAVGNTGTSYFSIDNGATWTPLTTGTTVNLYTVDASANFAWAAGNSGIILKLDGSVLPVELTSFIASVINQQVKLNWATATEINNNGFEVQRKSEGHDFVNVGFVKGNGTSTSSREYSFVDKSVTSGKYSYRLKQIDFSGAYNYSKTVEVEVRIVASYSLEQNYPNPFNPTTKIGYILKDKSNTKISILNAIGQEVAVLINEEQEAGYHQLDFNASNLTSGIYFYKLEAGNFTKTMKMILLK